MPKTDRPTLIVALLAAAGALSACNRDDAARTAVREGGTDFQTVAVGDPNAFRDTALKTYQAIASRAEDYAGTGNGYAEGAAITVAQARLGEAALAARDAAKAEISATQRIRVIRAALGEWTTLSALAQAASTFNPSVDLADLDKLVAIRQQDAERYAAEKARVDAQVSDLEGKIDALHAKAADERRQAGELELQMTGVSATRAAEIAADVREHTLRADQHELEATRLSGRVGQLRPTAAEIALNVGKANAQITLLRKSQDELRDRARASEADAAEARAAATQARSRLGKLASDLAEFRAGEVASTADKVTSVLRQAETANREASAVLQNSANATRAAIQEALGAAWSRRATGHAEAAAIFDALSAAKVWDNADEQAKAERAAADEALTATNEAYRAAAGALRQIRVTGDARDKLEAAATRLDRLAGVEPEPEYSEPAADEDTGSMDDTGDEYQDDEPAEDTESTPEDEG